MSQKFWILETRWDGKKKEEEEKSIRRGKKSTTKREKKEEKVAKALDGQRYPLPLCEYM